MFSDSPKVTTADALLGMLTMEPMSGYKLKQRIQRTIGNFWSESYGQIYPALKRLEKKGLVRAASEGKGAGKIYSITKSGRKYLRGWLEIAPRHRGARNELLLKLFFGVLAPPGSLRAHLLATRARYAADLARYERNPQQLEANFAGNPGLPFWLTTLSYGMAEARMIVAWCDETIITLERLEAKQSRIASLPKRPIKPLKPRCS